MSVWTWLGDHGVEVLALVASGGAVVYSRRATRIAQASADFTRRTTEVAERTEQRAVADAARAAVDWRLSAEITQLDDTHGVRLVNTGTGTAYDVYVELPHSSQTIGSYVDGREREPGVPLSLEVALPRPTPRDPLIQLRWRTSPDGDVQSRVYPFPF